MTRTTATPLPDTANATLVELFATQVLAHGADLAVRHGETALSYAELDDWSTALAGRLVAAGVGPGELVGLSVDRSPAVIAAILALLKVQAGFVALEPAVPLRRRRRLLADTAPVALFLSREHDRFPDSTVPRIWVGNPERVTTPVPQPPADPDAVFQVVHTSGTTGTPKGVVIGQASVLNRLRWMWQDHPFADDSVLLAHKSYGLVAAAWELLGGLLAGVPTVLLDHEDMLDPEVLIPLLAEHSVTHLFLTPHLIEALLAARDRHPELGWAPTLVTSGADVLSPELALRLRAAYPQARLLNLYGLTECSSNIAAYNLADLTTDAVRVPVGRPVAGARIRVVDRAGRRAPIGTTGEIWVGGPVLAQGYHHHHAADAGRPPFTVDDNGERFFRTGDLGRWRQDGVLEVTGRTDNQVKVRGFRVELEEIEAVLARAPHVLDVATTVVSTDSGPVLTAAVVGDDELDIAAMRATARDTLPDYMIPGRFVRLGVLPITVTGKLDRPALAQSLAARTDEQGSPALVAFADETQRRIAQLWTEDLGLTVWSPAQNFFDVGGHSLLAVRLITLLRERLDSVVSLRTFYRTPTIVGLAEHVASGGVGDAR